MRIVIFLPEFESLKSLKGDRIEYVDCHGVAETDGDKPITGRPRGQLDYIGARYGHSV